ncbi:MAG: class II fructose-bisphosphate aldolase [Kiritimatiellae bacterium]|nr:class II fructose-bisphosphate aldolase [Kiritimatiellia bacterium]
MALVTTKDLIQKAEAGRFAVPALNVYNLETLQSAIEAVSSERACAMIQIYDRLFTGSGMGPQLAEIACSMAREADVPLAVTLDHGASRDTVMRALRAGCTGIMFDGSTLDLEENIRQTRDVVQLCRAVGVSVEGEIGHVGVAAQGDEDLPCTPAEDAIRFFSETGVDLLAIMIGSAHGIYKKTPKLNIERIRDVHDRGQIPVVLHGGSGIPDEQIRLAVAAGIRKINYATDINLALLGAMAQELNSGSYSYALDLFMQKPMDAAKAFMVGRIRLLGASGQAQSRAVI